jgi:hypothetical protein
MNLTAGFSTATQFHMYGDSKRRKARIFMDNQGCDCTLPVGLVEDGTISLNIIPHRGIRDS